MVLSAAAPDYAPEGWHLVATSVLGAEGAAGRLGHGVVARDRHRNRPGGRELDQLEPPLPVLLQYARAAGVHMEDIVDDELDLPPKLPGNVRYQGLKRSSKSRRKR